MARIITAALENIIVERDMPSGYTWAKVIKCWTLDPTGARFFAQMTSDFGDEIPAAYFTSVVVYDKDIGYHERDIKFIGAEAEALNFALKEAGQIALISTEGHLSTKEVTLSDGKKTAKTTIMVKLGKTRIFQFCKQTARADYSSIEEMANATMKELGESAPPQASVDTSRILAANPDETIWPGLSAWIETGEIDGEGPPFDATDHMDKAPF